MALAPRFAATRYGLATARHALEFYLDWVCPFSKKQLFGIRQHLIELVDGELKNDLSLVIRSYPQPWHGSSTYTHEAFLAAVKLENGAKAWSFAYALMEKQEDYFDANVQDETPNQTRKRLAKLAKEAGLDEAEFLKLISLAGTSLNSGTQVTDDLKLQAKLGRQNGIHVTPTVLLDGLIEPSISSSFGQDEWATFVDEKIRGK